MNIFPTASLAAVPGAAEAAAASRQAVSAASNTAAAASPGSTAPVSSRPAGPARTAATPVDERDLKNSVAAINQFLKSNDEVQFSIDADSGYSVVKVIDTESRKVLRQFPSQQVLDIGKDLSGLKGILVDSQA